MKKKKWAEARMYCLRCQRNVTPRWDERRELWECPDCRAIVHREPTPRVLS